MFEDHNFETNAEDMNLTVENIFFNVKLKILVCNNCVYVHFSIEFI